MKCCFTLTELIIILTVAVLAIAMLPAMTAGATSVGKDIQCVSNKKQFALAQSQYAADHEELYVGYVSGRGWWCKVLTEQKYLPVEVLFCTGNPSRPASGGKKINRALDYVYGMPRLDWAKKNSNLEKRAGDCLEILKDDDGVAPTSMIVSRFIDKHFIFAADAQNLSNRKSGGSYVFMMTLPKYRRLIHLAHEGRSAVAVTDGSAKLMTAAEMAADPGSRVRFVINGDGQAETLY